MEKRLFTSESVSEGHPDKLCDQISDAILDAYLKEDPYAHVACECFITTERLIIGGEIRSQVKVDVEKIAREVLFEVGYTDKEIGIGYDTCMVENLLHEQSSDIAMGIEHGQVSSLGAGDQGMMFGYATTETDGFMPLPIVVAHKLVRVASDKRKNNEFKWARPDMKSQVTIDYTNPYKPKVDTILMSIQHDPDFQIVSFHEYIKNEIIDPVLKSFDLNTTNYRLFINPTSRFVIGGPMGDSGLTGRKIIVDTYGGYSRHGGGAFSGKDATKVDRSAAYAARWVAKNIVAAGLTDECEVQLSYAIGVAEPISIMVETFGKNRVPDDLILRAIRETFDLTPAGIISHLKLREPIYRQTATYGHMGRHDIDLPWEHLDRVEALKRYLKKE